MDKCKSNIRPVDTGVLQKRRSKVRVGARKLSKRPKPKASVKGSKAEEKDSVPKGTIKGADSMEVTVLVVFWGTVIIVAEIAKWVAAFHFAKYLPWIKTFMGGH